MSLRKEKLSVPLTGVSCQLAPVALSTEQLAGRVLDDV